MQPTLLKNLIMTLLAFCICSASFSQKKKDIKKDKIKSTTETITKIENGKEVTYKDSYTSFDKNGNIIEEINYNKDGTVKKRHTSRFDDGKNKTEEIEYEGVDGKAIQKKHQYSYNSKGDKILEITYDGAGKLIKKEVYTYNSLGLRDEKKVYDAKNVLIESHKYSYEM